MRKKLKIYSVGFIPKYPTGGCLIIAAFDDEQAREIAAKTITHTDLFTVTEVDVKKPMVIVYKSGDY